MIGTVVLEWVQDLHVKKFGMLLSIGSCPVDSSPAPEPARLTQRRQQFAPQGSAGQQRQAHIDGLGRERLLHVARIRASKASGNLFGRAALNQVGLDILSQPGAHEFTRTPSSPTAGRGPGPRSRSHVLRHSNAVASLCHGDTVADQGLKCCTWS